MASTPTTRNRFNKQAQGDNIGSWGSQLNTSVFDLVDEAVDGVTTVAITGNVTLTTLNYASDQARRRILRLTGSPSASYIVTIPGVEKLYIVHNTTNAPQQLKAGGLAATIPANTLSYVYCDGTDSFAPAATVNAAIGAVMDFAGTAAPAGWLLCGGQAVSRITYSSLFQVIQTTYGVGDGSTTFNVPDLRGRASFGKDDMGGSYAGRITAANSFGGSTTLGATGGDDRPQSHNHTVSISDPTHSHGKTETAHSHGISDPGHVHSTTDPQHNHGVNDPTHSHGFTDLYVGGGSAIAPGSSYQPLSLAGTTAAAVTGISIQNNATGISVNNGVSNISVQGATSNVVISAAATGITASSGFSGAGNSGNMPPAMILYKIIYSGV
jgi:microcystin-dependent protein